MHPFFSPQKTDTQRKSDWNDSSDDEGTLIIKKGFNKEELNFSNTFYENYAKKIINYPAARANNELKDCFKLTSTSIVSISRNMTLEPMLYRFVYWLDQQAEDVKVGSASFFLGLTLFYQMLDVNQRQQRPFNLEHLIAACFVLATDLEEDHYYFCQYINKENQVKDVYVTYQAYLAKVLSSSSKKISQCMKHTLKSLNHDLYYVEDIYGCYLKTLYESLSLDEHYLFKAYLALIRCNYRFTRFENRMILAGLSQCLFNKNPGLEIYILGTDDNEYDECKRMVAWLIYQFPLSNLSPSDTDNHVSLKSRGVNTDKLKQYFSTSIPAVQGYRLTDVLIAGFLERLRQEDEWTYQWLSCCCADFYSLDLRAGLNHDKALQQVVLSWFDKLSMFDARNKFITLRTHFLSVKSEAAYRQAQSSLSSSASLDSLAYSEEAEESIWEVVSSVIWGGRR